MKRSQLFYLTCLAAFTLACQNIENASPLDGKGQQIEYRQHYISNHTRITPCEASQLKYYVDPNCIPTDHQVAIVNGIAAYNSAGSSIHFEPVTNIAEAHIIFVCTNTGVSNECGAGKASGPSGPADITTFPSGGTVGKFVYLRLSWTSCICTEPPSSPWYCNYSVFNLACVLQRTVMHELGHTIGIAHNLDSEIHLIPGTPQGEYDPHSVFNDASITLSKCEYCNPNCAFNANDLTAIRYLYPPCLQVPKISVTFDPCRSLFYLHENNNPSSFGECQTQFNWTLSGLTNTPLMTNGTNPAQVRVAYRPGEQICVGVTVTNPCYSSDGFCYTDNCKTTVSTPCQVCFTAPGCNGSGLPVEGEISNSCNPFKPCPTGFICVNRICCPDNSNLPCNSDSDCPSGFVCIDGICEDIR